MNGTINVPKSERYVVPQYSIQYEIATRTNPGTIKYRTSIKFFESAYATNGMVTRIGRTRSANSAPASPGLNEIPVCRYCKKTAPPNSGIPKMNPRKAPN